MVLTRPDVVTVPLTEPSAVTLMLAVPLALVVTGGTSWAPLSFSSPRTALVTEPVIFSTVAQPASVVSAAAATRPSKVLRWKTDVMATPWVRQPNGASMGSPRGRVKGVDPVSARTSR